MTNVLNTPEHMDITVAGNPKRMLHSLLFIVGLCLMGLIFFVDVEISNVSPTKMLMGRYLIGIMLLVGVYFSHRYRQAKKAQLHINQTSISWGVGSRSRCIDWASVQGLVVVDLTTVGRGVGWIYEFTTVTSKPGLNVLDKFEQGDYFIEHQALLSIFERQSDLHHFAVTMADKKN
jgi:hypothetical protein